MQIKQLIFPTANLGEVKSSAGINWLINDSLVFKKSPEIVRRDLKQEVDGQGTAQDASAVAQTKWSEQHKIHCVFNNMVLDYHLDFTKKELGICFQNTI